MLNIEISSEELFSCTTEWSFRKLLIVFVHRRVKNGKENFSDLFPNKSYHVVFLRTEKKNLNFILNYVYIQNNTSIKSQNVLLLNVDFDFTC